MLDLKNKRDKIIIVPRKYFFSYPVILDYELLWFMCNKLLYFFNQIFGFGF